MKAVVFRAPKLVRVEEREEPRVEQPRDAVLRVTSAAICGSDLHIYNGLIPQVRPFVLGHEFVGVVEEVGPDVTNLRAGDRVVVPFPIADGECWFCRHGLPTQCEASNPNYGPDGGLLKGKGGGLFGYTDLYGGHDGGQAERVRVPFADYGPRRIPDGMSDEEALPLADILPTGYTAIRWAEVKEGETVAVFGCGPVGLMALRVATHLGARAIAVDVEPTRLAHAKRHGDVEIVNAAEESPVDRIRALTGGRGADVCVDAVGMEADRNILEKMSAVVHLQRGSMKVITACLDAVRRGGRVSVVGVYGTPYDNFPVGQVFDKELRLSFGQALVHELIDELLALVQGGELRVSDVFTHTFPLADAPRAYRMFNDKEDGIVKPLLRP